MRGKGIGVGRWVGIRVGAVVGVGVQLARMRLTVISRVMKVISVLLSVFIFPLGEDRTCFDNHHYITTSGSYSQPDGVESGNREGEHGAAVCFQGRGRIDENTVAMSVDVADVIIVKGAYQIVYSELDGDSPPAAIRIGARIKQGDLVGYGNMTGGGEPGTFFEMIHWEFGSISPVIDRFCPLTYFTAESQRRIELIWAQTDLAGDEGAVPVDLQRRV